MKEIALELGLAPGWKFVLRTLAMFTIFVCCLNLLQGFAWHAVADFYLALHALSWAGWFVWQGIIFPRSRQRLIASAGPCAYAIAFYTNIWPGVCWGVSNMTLPVALGITNGLAHNSFRLTAGLCIVALGTTLLVSGFRTIGLARAGFLAEYTAALAPLCHCSIYGFMRHPLFVGGVLVSIGGTLAVAAVPNELLIALLNVAILPIYASIEDRRLAAVFGVDYANYARLVGGIAPRCGHLLQALSRGSHLGPSSERR